MGEPTHFNIFFLISSLIFKSDRLFIWFVEFIAGHYLWIRNENYDRALCLLENG